VKDYGCAAAHFHDPTRNDLFCATNDTTELRDKRHGQRHRDCDQTENTGNKPVTTTLRITDKRHWEEASSRTHHFDLLEE
jgi:hypothetical protein